MRSAIVTGSEGFIGSHLAERLGDNCWLVDRNLGEQYDVSRWLGSFKPNAEKIIYHLAADSSDEKPTREVLENNINSTIAVLETARVWGMGVVFASSSSVYADKPWPLREDREDLAQPVSPYATSKLVCERLCELYWRRHKVSSVAFRLFNVYGPRGNGVVNVFYDGFVGKGPPPQIHGNGRQRRDFIHVDDVVDAFVLAGEWLKSHEGFLILNVGTGKSTSVNQLYGMMTEIYGKPKVEVRCPDADAGVKWSCANTKKAKKEIGFVAKIGLEEGLKRLE